MREMERRQFLKAAAAGLAAMPVAMSGVSAFAGQSRWPGLADAIVINALGGVSDPNKRGQQGRDTMELGERAIKDALASGTTAVNMTIGYVDGPMEPFEYSVQTIARCNDMIKRNPEYLLKVESVADILAAKQAGKIGIIQGFQNAAMMGDKAERVDIFAGLGVKIIQLTYNIANQIGDGSMAPENRGLSEFGRDVVARLNATNTLVDLSHSGEQTCLDAIRISDGPISITHSGCRALSNVPRNKTDEELRLLADKGGVVGIYFMPFLKEDSFPNTMDVVRHIEHAVNVCGEDHVGIGTDGGTTKIDDMQAFHAMVDKEIASRQAAGISAKGEKMGVVPFVEDLQGPDQFQKIADILYANGHSSARIEKILGKNFVRLMSDVWGA
ncbi:dipeptidase [Kordiimonas pumila]|uniref:Dipeptidase n=1 Tax=Kordiimonas pumila TaxID=2161677 RepID=A0ABV7D4B9_9PROT|nr:membrane dipeptidase [Kordiimonas pumila]